MKKAGDVDPAPRVSQSNTGAPNIRIQQCTFNINNTPVEKFGEAETLAAVKSCLESWVPELVGVTSGGVEITLDENKISLVDTVKKKTNLYRKAKNELLNDSEILNTLGNEAYYLGQMDEALRSYKEALRIFEELGDTRSAGIMKENIRSITTHE
ncbi:hypothetical protein DRN70_00440 [Methanosarcinales archaeon]|nr:MAG: hypothetical protein DRN70_00440 [Methanosarcinales archaeon]